MTRRTPAAAAAAVAAAAARATAGVGSRAARPRASARPARAGVLARASAGPWRTWRSRSWGIGGPRRPAARRRLLGSARRKRYSPQSKSHIAARERDERKAKSAGEQLPNVAQRRAADGAAML